MFVVGLPQDLLGGKSLNQENIRVILDKDSEICGLHPLDENNEQHYQESFEFISEPGRPTDLFYFRLNKCIGPNSISFWVSIFGITD